MESTDEHDMESDTDQISVLPGDLLQKILSSVRIRTVVWMRRLSRKWRKVCESLQFIHLDHRDFERWKVEKFTCFVNNLLLVRRKVDLHTFQLHWDHYLPLNCNDVRLWIGYAVKHNVKVLDVNLSLYDKTGLPPCIFTCRSLQELNLQWGEAPYQDLEHMGLMLPDIINLPSLKRLTLRDVEVGEFSLNKFVARSPGLEDLHLINSAMYLDVIASKVLKRLTIDGFIDGCNGFTISAPHLISFECRGCSLNDISWRGQPSLESAQIGTCGCTFDGESEFTGVLVHAKKLALFGSDVKVMLEKELPTCSMFESLVTLEIGEWYLTEDFYVVLRFLRLSPRLEKLTLIHMVMLEKELPTCSMFESLVTLEIGEWYLTEDFYVVLRFLRLSPRLEKLTLIHRSLHREAEGAEKDGMPIDGMTFQCPFLESVMIQCSEGDDGIDKLVNVLVVNGIKSDKISITFYEDIEKRALAETVRAREERSNELSIFDKMAKKNPEWVDDDPYALSDPDSEQSDPYSDEYDDPDDF